jgi:L-ascorbate metabolism protein UlaG (beta-lactamase superfamily)
VRIGALAVDYIAHVCFRFRSPGGRVLVTDPLFGDGFWWQGHYEKYLSPPAIAPEDIRKCDVVFVTHAHGDHFDPDAVLAIQRGTGCGVLAAAEILEALEEAGAEERLLLPAGEGQRFDFGDLGVTTYCGYDDSFDARGRPNKFAAAISSEATDLFYSGDCHGLPPGVRGRRFDAAFSWPFGGSRESRVKLRAFCEGIGIGQFVLMHGDRFEPGEFCCNLDYEAEKRLLESALPEMKVVIPTRASGLED